VRFGRTRDQSQLILGRERCLNLLHDHSKRDELLDVLIDAGESAWARGAHEVNPFVYTAHFVNSLTSTQLAIQSFVSARTLLRADAWSEEPSKTFNLLSRLAASDISLLIVANF